MCSHYRNKLTAVSFAMAAAGILTCAAALLDVFIPSGSFVGFLAKMALLGLAVTGVVIGYTWVCDKCENYFIGRRDRFLNGSEPSRNEAVRPRAAVSPRPTEPRVAGDARSTPDARQPFFCGGYTPTLRGSVSPSDATRATAARAWHGQ